MGSSKEKEGEASEEEQTEGRQTLGLGAPFLRCSSVIHSGLQGDAFEAPEQPARTPRRDELFSPNLPVYVTWLAGSVRLVSAFQQRPSQPVVH